MDPKLESLLGFADAPSAELRARLLQAAQYAGAWETKLKLAPPLRERLKGIARQGAALAEQLGKHTFPNRQEKVDYEALSKTWAATVRDVALAPQFGPVDPLGIGEVAAWVQSALQAAGAGAAFGGTLAIVLIAWLLLDG